MPSDLETVRTRREQQQADELNNPADRAVITRITMKDWEKLKKISKCEGRSIAGQVRLLISNYVKSTNGEPRL